jgi:hypothetical protein
MSRLRVNSLHEVTIGNAEDPYWTEYRSQFTYFVEQKVDEEEYTQEGDPETAQNLVPSSNHYPPGGIAFKSFEIND